MRAVLVDDEYYALIGLKSELDCIDGVEVVGMYESGKEFIQELSKTKPDIIFLDIEMPELSGFEILEQILETLPGANIVFITAFNEYAVKAFEYNALDYIIKPPTQDRLQKTIQRLQPVSSPINEKKLRIQCFRGLSFFVDNLELKLEWRTKKALELISYLIYEKGKFISKEKIAETLWPEMNGEKGISNLYLSYYYIKRQEKIKSVVIPVESERGKMRICLDKVECDITEFDYYIENCKSVDKQNISLAEKAEELYLGQLFEDGYYDWSTDEQQRYDILYDELINHIINYYHNAGNKAKYNYYKAKYNNYRNK